MTFKSSLAFSSLRFSTALVLLFSALTPQLSRQSPDLPAIPAWILENVTIVSPERDQPLEHATVVVQGERIAWVGDSSALPKRWGSLERTDGQGRFLVPGLVDAHVHVGHAAFFGDDHYESEPELLKAYREQLPRSYLFYGFTSLLDLDLKSVARRSFEATPVHPTLYGGGRGVRLYEGYGPSLMPPELRYRIFPTWIFNEAQREHLPAAVNPELHTVEAILEAAVESNARFIKTYHESGFGVFDWPVPSPDLLAYLVQAAHERELPVLLHATSLGSFNAGLDAGVDVFVHGMWHWPGDRLDPTPPPAIQKTLAHLAQAGSGMMPTMRVILGERDTFNWSLIEHPQLADCVSPKLITWLKSEPGRWAQRAMHELYAEHLPKGNGSTPAGYLEATSQRVLAVGRLAQAEGVRLLFGSDTPAAEGVGNTPGLNGHLERQAWAAAGIPPAALFAALTLSNAEAFGLAAEIGSVEAGKRADLLLLRKSPLLSVDAYDSLEHVVLRGQLHARGEFSARE